MGAWRALVLLFLSALAARADGPVAPAPIFSLELEPQFAQPDAPSSQSFGAALWGVWKFTDQLSATAAVSGLTSRAGPFGTAGLGLRGMIDITPVVPFVDAQLVALGPESAVGYRWAARVGGGADYRAARAFAVGVAVRTLMPLGASTQSGAPGLEVSLRLVLTPALLQ